MGQEIVSPLRSQSALIRPSTSGGNKANSSGRSYPSSRSFPNAGFPSIPFP